MNSILEAVLIFPLTAGFTKWRHTGNDVRDGKISSAVITAALISVSLTVTLVFGALFHQRSAAPSNILWGFFTLKHFASIICIVALTRVLYKNKNNLLQRRPDYSIGRKILFLWIFGFGFVIQDGMNIAVNAQCDFIESRDHLIYTLGICSHLIGIAFTVSEMGFISFFSKYRVCSTKLTNYALLFILASNLTDWFKGVMREMFKAKGPSWFNTNDTEFHYFNSCYSKSVIKTVTVKHLYPIILPAQTEYSLLATLVLLGMMSSRTSYGQDGSAADIIVNENNESREISSTDSVVQTSYDDRHDDEYYARESDRLLQSINGPVINHEQTRSRPLSFYVTIFIGLILSIPILVVTMIKSQTKMLGSYISTNAFITVGTFFSIAILVIVWCTFHTLRTQCRQDHPRPISSSEWLLIFSNFGLGIFRTFNISSFVLSDEPHTSLENFLFLRHPIVFINSFFQTILIIQAQRYKKLQTRNINPHLKVEHCFLLLHILNFVLWFTSIFTTKHLAAKMKDENRVFGPNVWDTFLRVTWPINIFYCFHSAMDLYGLYRKFDEKTY